MPSRSSNDLPNAIATIPPGAYAIGVSGGADSVALLTLLHSRRPDFRLHVVHLNHETRGPDSDADARLVQDLAAQLALPCTVARLSEITLTETIPNPSARFRAARMALFARVVAEHNLNGVILAHHA